MHQVYIKTRIFSGEDALERLEKFEEKKIWLISDSFLVENGSINNITNKLHASNKVVVCGDVVPEPPIEVIAKGVALISSIEPDIIIAYGGGSAIDTAKGVLYFARLRGYTKKIKFIAIPTTSGTGSEVTSATVISDTASQVKHPIVNDELLPDEVILCPMLTVSVPPKVTANTGMDVLTHAIEAYVSVNANSYSDALAQKACELVFGYLEKCFVNGGDLEARSRMQEASNIAGCAFNIAGLGMNHAIAHQIGALFHIPHGLANALILSEVIRHNSMICSVKMRYADLSRKLNLAESTHSDERAVEILCESIDGCMKSMDMPLDLSQCGVQRSDLEKNMRLICENALKDGCAATAARIFDFAEIESILYRML